MAVVTMRQLLEAGIHFGHQTRRWNPKMARYIFGERNGIYIIDLQKTLRQLRKAYAFVRDTAAAGGTVLFVGTKKQAHEPIQAQAERCGMFYVKNRWLGGTLTNFRTVQQSIKTLVSLEELEAQGGLDKLSKKEAAARRRFLTKLQRNLGGIKRMPGLPSVVFVIDAKRESTAVREADRVGIPCIGVVDTNADPDAVPLPVPGNDDAIRAVGLFCSIMADAVIEGRSVAEKLRGGVPDIPAQAAEAQAPEAPAAEKDISPEVPEEDESSDEDGVPDEDGLETEEEGE
jgi:small subunit ribosomal protein S2